MAGTAAQPAGTHENVTDEESIPNVGQMHAIIFQKAIRPIQLGMPNHWIGQGPEEGVDPVSDLFSSPAGYTSVDSPTNKAGE